MHILSWPFFLRVLQSADDPKQENFVSTNISYRTLFLLTLYHFLIQIIKVSAYKTWVKPKSQRNVRNYCHLKVNVKHTIYMYMHAHVIIIIITINAHTQSKKWTRTKTGELTWNYHPSMYNNVASILKLRTR